MIKGILFALCGLIAGALLGYFFLLPHITTTDSTYLSGLAIPKKEVIGFLPYWQTDVAKKDYSSYITTLTYFGLALDTDGSILKLATPQQLEPGWNALSSGKVSPFLQAAKKEKLDLSLLIFSGNPDTIESVLNTPVTSATHLTTQVKPIMQQYGFTDLNLDIEYTRDATQGARNNFVAFVQKVRDTLPQTDTLTVEIVTNDVLKPNFVDVPRIGKIADHVVIMAYDYHSPTSYVTGPVAPLGGAGVTSELDVTTAVQKAVALLPSQKIILGMPLYGYAWDSLSASPRSAIIDGSGVIASNHRAEALLETCATCSATLDPTDMEMHVSYKNTDTGTYIQMFYPVKASTQAKVDVANEYTLGGVALWALGYEGDTILDPLKNYKTD